MDKRRRARPWAFWLAWAAPSAAAFGLIYGVWTTFGPFSDRSGEGWAGVLSRAVFSGGALLALAVIAERRRRRALLKGSNQRG